MGIELKRAYEKPSVSDGVRVLVDRLWPRGLTKEAARLDHWLRELAPSDELRQWYHSHQANWAVFRKRYLHELSSPEATAAFERLHRLADTKKTVTLVYASKDEVRNNAVVLKELLDGMRKPPSTSGPAKAAALPRARTQRRR